MFAVYIFYTGYLKIYLSIHSRLFEKLTSCIAINKTVLRLNFLLHISNRSSKDGPNNSRTIAL